MATDIKNSVEHVLLTKFTGQSGRQSLQVRAIARTSPSPEWFTITREEARALGTDLLKFGMGLEEKKDGT